MKADPPTGQSGMMKTAHSGLIILVTYRPGLHPDLRCGTIYVLQRANHNHFKKTLSDIF